MQGRSRTQATVELVVLHLLSKQTVVRALPLSRLARVRRVG
jgi:hypothetical protein